MKPARLFLIALVALGLAPGTWLRSDPAPTAFHAPIRIERLDTPAMRLGPFTLAGAWHITSPGGRSGGYSALIANSPDSLVAASDTGRLMIVELERGAPVAARLKRLGQRGVDKVRVDIESLTRDPASGTVWAGYEDRNAIQRLDRNFDQEAIANPPAMRGWGSNTGPEAMARLPDGRFLVIEERERGGLHRALLFPGDPTLGTEPVEFRTEVIEGFFPVDATAMAGGRVLVLLRRIAWGMPPRFEGAIMAFDPERIAPGEVWRGRLLARLEPPLPMDNFEGMALTREADGARYLWLISDDNMMRYQRTLLLKLRWEPERQRARGMPARP